MLLQPSGNGGLRAGYFTFQARKRLTHDFIAHQWVLESAQGLLLAPFVACDILLDKQGGLTMEVARLEEPTSTRVCVYSPTISLEQCIFHLWL